MQYRLVRFSGDQAVLCTLRSDVQGVLLNTPASGEDAEICIFGKCPVRCDGGVISGHALYPDASGFAAGALLTGEGSALTAIGHALQNDGAAGEVVEQFISRFQLEL
jgi:hypothetical protein